MWLSLFFLFSFFEAAAQKKVYLGLKAGGNFSKITRNEYAFVSPNSQTSNQARFGTNFNPELGLIANFAISDSLSFQPELLLVKKGYQAFGIYNDKNGKANQKSYEHWVNTHIELPLLVKFSVGNKKTKFFLAAGPAFSFWNSSYFNRNATGENAVREKFKVEHKFRQTLFKQIDTVTVNGIENIIQTAFDSITVKARSEISAVFATGFHYKLKKSLIIFDIRYGYGLTPLFSYLEDKRPLNYKDGFPAENIPPKSKEFNRRFSFSVSYLFAFKN